MPDLSFRQGQHELNVELPVSHYTDADAATFQELFNLQYRKSYGRTIPNLDVEALTWTLFLSGPSTFHFDAAEMPAETAAPARVRRSRQVFDAELGGFVEAAMISRGEMRPGACFAGPAVIKSNVAPFGSRAAQLICMASGLAKKIDLCQAAEIDL